MAPPDDDTPEYPPESERPPLLRWDHAARAEAAEKGTPARRSTDHLASQAIGLAGWDLSDPDEMWDFVETLRTLKKRVAAIRERPKRRKLFAWTIIGAVSSAILTFEIPKVAAWLMQFLP